MKKLHLVISLLTLTFVGAAMFSGSANAQSRYYVSGSENGLAVARVVVSESHHEFTGGFTGDLSPGQVRALDMLSKFTSITVEPVGLYYITAPPGACSPWPECKNGDGNGGGGSDGDVVREYTPSDQTPWGIERMYNNSAITSTSGGAGVDVAVLDTGVNKNHLDLSRRVAQCKDFTPRRGMKDGSCTDKNGHGTHVSGTILADGGNDGLGVYGMAPEANLWAYRVCGNSGSCWADDIAAAMQHATDQGVEIISMSLGGDLQSTLIKNAVDYATANGVLVVAAAGNDGPQDGSIDYPGANAKVVAVGAINSTDSVPDWSSRGVNDGDYVIEDREVEFAAPGVSVESTLNDGGYGVMSGTSMATPHMAGLAAKFWQGSATATRNYLQNLAEDIWTLGDDSATGFGLPTVQ